MLSFLKALQRNERGNVLILTAAALPLIVGSAGLATDTIQWALWKRQLQRAADSAAIAGTYERVRADGATAGVVAVVTQDLALNQHTGIDLKDDPTVETPANTPADDRTNRVRVVLQIQRPLSFSSMFMSAAPTITAEATAASVPGGANPCVRSLEFTTAMGIQGSGNGTVRTNCPWMTNSKGNKSAVAKGSSTIYASVIASAGAIEESANFHVDRYDAYVPQLPDPLINKNPTGDEMKCAVNTVVTTEQVNDGTKKNPIWRTVTTTTHTPIALTETTDMANAKDENGNPANCYSSMSIGSGGTLNVPATVTGPIFINGGSVNIQGTVNAANNTLILSNKTGSTIGSIDMNANGNLNITAPTTGKYAGIAIYQDRRATDSGGNANNMPANSPNKINGNSSSKIQGIVYFPNQQITFNGGGNGTWVCMQLIARRIQFSGNSEIKFSNDTATCSGRNLPVFNDSGRRVRLVA